MALITELDDQVLVEAHQAGDEHAFAQIVDRHHQGLLRHAYRRLADPSLAEDAVQETLLRAFRGLPRFEGDYRLDAWLHRILTNVCFDMGRRRGRDGRLFDKVSGIAEVATPAVDDDIPDDDPALVAALEALPDGYRDVLVMRLVDELSYADVAVRAGISEDNARARVSRGRSMLRTMLSGVASAIMWLIPPLRRDDLTTTSAVTDGAQTLAPGIQAAAPAVSTVAPAASSAASAASAAAPAMSSASTILAQAGPALAQAAPAVQSTAPVFGKAALAVGIAATVAIPAGKAVEERINPPAPAEVTEEAAATDPGAPVIVETPTTVVAAPTEGATTIAGVEPASDDDAVAVDLAPDDGEGTDTDAETTEAPTTSAPPTTVAASEPTPTSAPPPTTPAPEPEPAGPPAALAGDLAVTEAGPRLEVSGPFTIDTPDGPVAGTLTGKLLIGDADPKDETAPRTIEGDLTLTLDDGTTLGLRLRGQVVVDTQGSRTTHDMTAVFRLDGGAAIGVDEAGDLTGTFTRHHDRGTLQLTLPTPAPADDA